MIIPFVEVAPDTTFPILTRVPGFGLVLVMPVSPDYAVNFTFGVN